MITIVFALSTSLLASAAHYFFTKDESSRMIILQQLSELTNTDLFNLQNNCYFEIIRANEYTGLDYNIFQDWINRQSA